MVVHVRTANESDLEAVAEIHVRSFQTAYRGIVPNEFLDQRTINGSPRGWASTFAKFPNNITVAATDENMITGFCCAGHLQNRGVCANAP